MGPPLIPFDGRGLVLCQLCFVRFVGVQSEALYGAKQSFALNSNEPVKIGLTVYSVLGGGPVVIVHLISFSFFSR
jgi:hypothetical protein